MGARLRQEQQQQHGTQGGGQAPRFDSTFSSDRHYNSSYYEGKHSEDARQQQHYCSGEEGDEYYNSSSVDWTGEHTVCFDLLNPSFNIPCSGDQHGQGERARGLRHMHVFLRPLCGRRGPQAERHPELLTRVPRPLHREL